MKTHKGAYVNLDHCDMFEVRADDRTGKFHLVAWNAYNAASHPHVLREFDLRKDADSALERLIGLLGKGIEEI